MLSYCLKCRKSTGSKILRFIKTKNVRIILWPNYEVSGSEKLIFIKEKESSALVSRLGIKVQIQSKWPITGNIMK